MNLLSLRRIPLAAAVAALAVGCGSEPPPDALLARDSAGISIAMHGADVLAALPEWTLGPPARSIGSGQDDPAHQLSEIVAAVRRADGRILVADAQSRELRVFDRDGRGVLTFAGQGEGPGELPWLRTLALHPGDTVTVSAWPFGLLSRFGPDGEYLASRRVGPFWSGAMNRILRDGSLLLYHADGGVGNNVEGWIVAGEDPTFTPAPALVRAFDGGRLDTLRIVRGDRWFKIGKVRVDLWAAPIPFAQGTLTAVAEPAGQTGGTLAATSEPTIYMGEPDCPELEVRSLDGRLEGLIRWVREPVPISARDREIFAARQRDDLRQPARAPQLERWLEAVPYPETKGAFLDLAADRAGRVWVRLPAPAGVDDPWVVFERGGRAVARVTVPAGGRLLDVGDAWALILLTDDLDLERVEERPILKP